VKRIEETEVETPTNRSRPKRIIVGMSGATGCIYGIRLLEVLRDCPDVETHLILSDYAKRTIEYECDRGVSDVVAMASAVYPFDNVGAKPASGSFVTEGMVIAPCSVKSMSMIAHSLCDNLLVRAADVVLKERRKLVLMVRETPLHLGHLRLMAHLSEIGAVILPPMPAFYHKPQTIDDIVNQSIGKVLDQFGIEHTLFARWNGLDEQ
jgi:4-hydroxy-3-polyprenylbenzoate decarboxylase